MTWSWNDYQNFSGSLGGGSGSSGGGGGGGFNWGGLITGGAIGINALASAYGANKQAETQKQITNAQLAAQADALKQGILFQRDSAKANIGLGMFGQIFGATTAPDIEFGRQAAAQRLELGEFTPKRMGLGREQATWETAFKGSPLYQDTARKERLGRLQETIAGYRAQPTGMFGRIAQAPIESLMV